jgi:hypothetical protein
MASGTGSAGLHASTLDGKKWLMVRPHPHPHTCHLRPPADSAHLGGRWPRISWEQAINERRGECALRGRALPPRRMIGAVTIP